MQQLRKRSHTYLTVVIILQQQTRKKTDATDTPTITCAGRSRKQLIVSWYLDQACCRVIIILDLAVFTRLA